MADAAAPAGPRPRPAMLLALLALAAVVGLVVSLAAWGFLEGVHQIQVGVFEDLPARRSATTTARRPGGRCRCSRSPASSSRSRSCGCRAMAATPGRRPGDGTDAPIELPGVMLAAAATIGLGLVLGPEAPLIALGGGLGILAVALVRRDAPDQVARVVAAAGSFAAVSFIFGSPMIAAVILIEATGLGGPPPDGAHPGACSPPGSARWSRSAWGR